MTTTNAAPAAISRLRRQLAKDGQRLCIPRSEKTYQDLGIHVVDSNNIVVAYHCNINDLLAEVA